MSNTTQGGRRARTTKPDLWYFDRLPPSAREALANANFNWAAGAVYNKWNRGVRGYKTGKDIALSVRRWDASVANAYRRN